MVYVLEELLRGDASPPLAWSGRTAGLDVLLQAELMVVPLALQTCWLVSGTLDSLGSAQVFILPFLFKHTALTPLEKDPFRSFYL